MATSQRLEDALVYAAQLHRDQLRKSGDIPYITHLLGVAWLVGEFGGDEEQIIAALLHDGPEDQGGRVTLDEIRRRFGDRVADIVEGCSDTMEDPKPPWKQRKQQYLANLKTASADVRLVSAADKLCNAQSILRDMRRMGDDVFKLFTGGKSGALWYLRAVTEEFERGGPAHLAAELRRVFAQIEHGGM